MELLCAARWFWGATEALLPASFLTFKHQWISLPCWNTLTVRDTTVRVWNDGRHSCARPEGWKTQEFIYGSITISSALIHSGTMGNSYLKVFFFQTRHFPQWFNKSSAKSPKFQKKLQFVAHHFKCGLFFFERPKDLKVQNINPCNFSTVLKLWSVFYLHDIMTFSTERHK